MESHKQNIQQYYTKALHYPIMFYKSNEISTDALRIHDAFAKYSSNVHDKLLLGLVLLGNGYLDESHTVIQEM